MSGLQIGSMDEKIAEATEFILERLETLGHSGVDYFHDVKLFKNINPDLASRLTLSCLKGCVEPQNVNDLPVTIIDVFDECSLTQVIYFFILVVKYNSLRRM